MTIPLSLFEFVFLHSEELSGLRTMPRDVDMSPDRLALESGEIEVTSDLRGADRRDDDPLERECPVCARLKGVIKETSHFKDIGNFVGPAIIENSGGGPKDGAGLRRPDLDESISLASNETVAEIGVGTADNTKQDMPNTKGRRLHVVRRVAWSGDRRRA